MSELTSSINLCVTVLNRYDLLRTLLLSIDEDIPVNVTIVDNGSNIKLLSSAIDGIKLPIGVFMPSPAMGLAESWNWFIDNTEGDPVIIANDDIIFSPGSLAKLQATDYDIAFAAGIGFSCFAITYTCVSNVGYFDTSLSPGFAYFEDCDYMFRMNDYSSTGRDVRMVDIHDHGIRHLGQGTQRIPRSTEELAEFRRKYYIAQENFISKWGRLPDGLRRMSKEECAMEGVCNG